MDQTLLTKSIASGLGVAAVLALALTGHVEGSAALDAIKVIVVAFVGSAAVLGGAQAIAKSLGSKS